MEWLYVQGNEAACKLEANVYLFIKSYERDYDLFVQTKDGEEFSALTSTHIISHKRINGIYSGRNSFFKELSYCLDGTGVDIDAVQNMLREVVKDITNNGVELSRPKRQRSNRVDTESDVNFVMDLDADVHGTVRPSDTVFNSVTDYLILEPVWVPYRRPEDGSVIMMPTLISKTPDSFKLSRYTEGMQLEKYFISGAFPAESLKTLMTINGVKQMMNVTPEIIEQYMREVDVELDVMLDKHLDLDEIKKILIKRYIEGTYFFQIMNAFAILNIVGPSESGKTRAGLCITSTSYHGEPTLDLTEAGIFRAKEELKPTMVVDEAEYLAGDDSFKRIKLLLNASYSKGMGYVHRYDDIGGAKVRVAFDLYSPFVIIAINPLTGITASRSIAVNMRRTDKDMPRATPYIYRELRNKLYTLKFHISDKVWEIYNTIDISQYVTARFDELFRPIFTLTKIFGTDEEIEMIGKWAKNYQQNFRVSAMNVARERDLLLVIWKMLKDPEKIVLNSSNQQFLLLKDIAAEMSLMFGEKYKSQTVGSILRTLGLDGRAACAISGKKGLTMARLESDDVKSVMVTYGIDIANE